METSFYKAYYQNTIENHKKGFKLVLGGTGLGKTKGIIEVIKGNTEPNKRFFYVANRLQLLKELENDLKKNKIAFCLQESDEDIIKTIDANELLDLLENVNILHLVEKLYPKNKKDMVFETEKNINFIESFKKDAPNNIKNILSQDLSLRSSQIFRFFRKIIQAASKQENKKPYQNLIKNQTVKKLFPYIDFVQNPTEKRIFLVSLQKSFYGFFDGQRTINIYKLKNNQEKNERNIIFLDEFDFLENDLLKQICKDISIENPFDFVEYVYNKIAKSKLLRKDFLKDAPDLRAKFEKIVKAVQTLPKKHNLPFPRINHFVYRDEQLKNISIFQTRYSVSSFPIYLDYNNKEHTFYLERVGNEKKGNAYILLHRINQFIFDVVRLFKEIELTKTEFHEPLMKICFSKEYKKYISNIRQYPNKRKSVGTSESKMYYNGFGLYEISDETNIADSKVAKFEYYALLSTPESILLNLTKNNLVFGLSATAEINRYVKSFDLHWLKNELGELYHQPSESDKEMIQMANEKKFADRQNQIQVDMIAQSAENSLPKKLNETIENTIHKNKEVFGIGIKQKYRKKRVVNFFASLQWISEKEAENSSNLLFFNSYKEILHFFENVKYPEREIYAIQKIDNVLEHCYQISFQKRNFIVLFFDADEGKGIEKLEKNRDAYDQLFWRSMPVLLVTTYSSAGNGVNLFYYESPKKESKKDFKNIHLLESPYYFFSPFEEESEESFKEKIKANIFYLAKLEKNKFISERKFKTYLGKIRNIAEFNNSYANLSDGLYNRVAIYIQALGRVERIWEKMEDQIIRLDKEVYNDLEDFCKIDDGDYKRYRQQYLKNLPYYSHNVSRMFEQILEQEGDRKLKISQVQWEGLKKIDDQCKTEIQRLLAKLNLLRQNQRPADVLQKIRKEWQDLREFALKQLYQESENPEESPNLLKKYHCTFESDLFDSVEKCFWIQKESKNIVPAQINPDGSFYAWKIDQVYKNIEANNTLKGHFEVRRYENSALKKGIYFTPYFCQCILAGAIGEEAVKAIFEKEKVDLNSYQIDNSLFELIDLKIKDKAWYIDAKNYSEQTIAHFSLDQDDHFYHPKLNTDFFKAKAKEKLAIISKFHQHKDCKLIYINVFGHEDRTTNYYNENFEEIDFDFESAKIIVVQNMLKSDDPQNYSEGFNHFIFQLKKQLNND